MEIEDKYFLKRLKYMRKNRREWYEAMMRDEDGAKYNFSWFDGYLQALDDFRQNSDVDKQLEWIRK